MVPLTRLQARRVLLASQGLASEHPSEPGADDVLGAIRRMHALQIDTIHVVARSPYLVLWSRLGNYEPRLLDQLLADHAIFEHWSHAACFLDIQDYPFYRRMMLDSQTAWGARVEAWFQANQPLVNGILDRIGQGGPVRSSDFERADGRKGNGWWDWKAEKVALEMLNTRGDLMVTARHNFQRVYDLRERVLPEWDDSLAPPIDEARRQLALDVVRTLGVARPEWVATNLQTLGMGKVAMRALLAQLATAGDVATVEVEGWPSPGYVHANNLPLLDEALAGSLALPGTTLLSPFDPLTWDRARALELFDFDYRIECYTPAPKRKYGYFTLPILHGDALVGRLDAKAHRKDGIFEVKSIHLEPGVAITGDLETGLLDALQRIAAWHKTPEVVIRDSYPSKLKSSLTASRSRLRRRVSPSPAKSGEGVGR